MSKMKSAYIGEKNFKHYKMVHFKIYAHKIVVAIVKYVNVDEYHT